MIDYYEQLTQEEKEEVTEVIQTLYRQTFLLERKFDKRAGRMQYTKEYRTCTKHLEFFKAYFEVAGIILRENVHMGVIYIQGEQLWGEKLPRLATIYLLVLKLIYDEQMQTASSSSHVVTTLGAVNGKAGEFHVLKSLPSITEMRRTIALLKKYQIIEPLSTFVFGNIIGGRLQDKYNPKIVVWIGGGIFAIGILASAFLIVPSSLPMYVTYGVMQGFGQGLIYTVIISTVQKWFPGRTGFASGVVVTANGLCGFFLAPISRRILQAEGPGKTFLIIGAAITISWILCGIFFTAPDKEWRRKAERALREQNVANGNAEAQTEQKQYTSAEMMKTKNFYLLLATMLFGLISYFLVSPVSQTYQIELGIPSAIAVSAVMIGSIVNAGTRLVLPTLSDKVGRVGCIKGVLAVSVVAMAILTFTRSYTVTAAIILMYGCYGGIMGSFPSFTSSIFGIEHTGENYGFVMLGIVIATCGAPALSGFITGKGYGMHVVFGMGIVFAVIALICLTILGHNLKKEEHGKEQKNNGISNDERITGACEE